MLFSFTTPGGSTVSRLRSGLVLLCSALLLCHCLMDWDGLEARPGGGGGQGGIGGQSGQGGQIVGATHIYWVDSTNDVVRRVAVGEAVAENLVTIVGSSFLRSIAVDSESDKIYFTDDERQTVQAANADGTAAEDIVTGLDDPVGIDIDVAAGKLYFVDQGAAPTIYRVNTDGSSLETLITTTIQHPYGIALDVAGGRLYIVDNGVPAVFSANLDGSDLQDLGIAVSRPIEVAFDPVDRQIYWTDLGADGQGDPTVTRANVDGSGVEVLFSKASLGALGVPLGIAVDEVARRLYFVDGSDGAETIFVSALDGSNVEPLIVNQGEPRGLELGF